MATNLNPREEDRDNRSEDSDSSDESDTDSVENGSLSGGNMFVNDGSFMEMFKKRMEAMQSHQSATKTTTKQQDAIRLTSSIPIEPTTSCEQNKQLITEANTATDAEQPKKSAMLSCVGKRRGGKVLPTGMVKKSKPEEQSQNEGRTDAWAQYMAEVRKYKERSCEDEGKTRPLVK